MLVIVADVATYKRETTDTVHVIAEEPDRASAPSVTPKTCSVKF